MRIYSTSCPQDIVPLDLKGLFVEKSVGIHDTAVYNLKFLEEARQAAKYIDYVRNLPFPNAEVDALEKYEGPSCNSAAVKVGKKKATKREAKNDFSDTSEDEDDDGADAAKMTTERRARERIRPIFPSSTLLF